MLAAVNEETAPLADLVESELRIVIERERLTMVSAEGRSNVLYTPEYAFYGAKRIRADAFDRSLRDA